MEIEKQQSNNSVSDNRWDILASVPFEAGASTDFADVIGEMEEEEVTSTAPEKIYDPNNIKIENTDDLTDFAAVAEGLDNEVTTSTVPERINQPTTTTTEAPTEGLPTDFATVVGEMDDEETASTVPEKTDVPNNINIENTDDLTDFATVVEGLNDEAETTASETTDGPATATAEIPTGGVSTDFADVVEGMDEEETVSAAPERETETTTSSAETATGATEENTTKENLTAIKPTEDAFVQSTDKAKMLQSDPDYFTYLVSSERGFAVKKSEAVNTFIDKIQHAEDNKTVWQALRLGSEIVNGRNDIDDKEKQRAKEFMNTPVFQKRKLEYDISNTEKRLKGMEEDIRRCEEEYNKLSSTNIIDKFLNRWKIQESRDRLANARALRERTLIDIRKRRDELLGMKPKQESTTNGNEQLAA